MTAPGHTEHTEREAKLSVPDEFVLPDLGALVPGLVAVAGPQRELRATYFDAPDLRLVRSGVTLRCRTGDREHGGEWTVKLPSGDQTTDHLTRREVNFPGECADGRVPDEVAAVIRARARSAPLGPVATVVTRRRTIDLRDSRGVRCVEIDDDDVTVTADGHDVERFREVEVELADDVPTDLITTVVDALRAAGARAAEPVPKVLHALGPAGREPPDLAVPKLDKRSALVTVVVAAVAAGHARLVEHDPDVRLGGDPEAVHQSRVATRRLRSDLRTLRPLLDQGRVRALRDELRWLGAALGTVRDSDVLLERLQADVAALDEPDQRGGRGLIERLERERERARGELLDVLASERYVALLDSLVAFGASPPLVGGGSRRARKAVPRLAARPWRRLRRAIANLPEPPSNDELHQVRIRVKHGRYAAELAAPVLGTPARRFARVLGALQDELGQLHDAVVAEQWLRTAASDVRAPGPFVAGLLAAKNRARQANRRRDWWALWRQARRKKLRRWLR